ncbi:MAG: hypothetical protein ACREDF_11800 [Thermoplasmata archaeon]
MTIRGECMYCKADTGPHPGVPWIGEDGTVFDKTSTVCEKCKPIIERQIEEVTKGNLDITIGKGGETSNDTPKT